MNRICALIAFAALVSPAFAQNMSVKRPVAQGIHPKPKLMLVPIAHKPLVLTKGRPLTAGDRNEFIASARLSFAKPGAKPRVMTANTSPAVMTINPDQMTTPGGFLAAGYDVAEWDPADGAVLMTQGPESMIEFVAPVTTNNLYVLTVTVNTYCAAQFTIAPAPNEQAVVSSPPSVVSVSAGKTGFAYAFDANQAGSIAINVSSNCNWEFLSAELATTPM
jgi:hypothetical protein